MLKIFTQCFILHVRVIGVAMVKKVTLLAQSLPAVHDRSIMRNSFFSVVVNAEPYWQNVAVFQQVKRGTGLHFR